MYLLFNTTRDVIKMEKKIILDSIKYKIIPVPRTLSSSCGLSIFIYEDFRLKVLKEIDSWNLNYKEIRDDL